MNGEDFFDYWAAMATWSIKEAAYLVNNLDPLKSEVTISPTSPSPVSKAYFWLMKEYKKGNLTQVAGSDREPRFSPGTLIRRLKEGLKLKIPKLLEAKYGSPGQWHPSHKQSAMAKYVYRAAAKLIWDNRPSVKLSEMAELLTGLPMHKTNVALPTRSHVTIRNYLKGMSPNKAGRPQKHQQELPPIDLAAIAKKLDEK